MNRGKKIEVNASSILDLKAELIRKQEEYKRNKLQNKPSSKPVAKKPNVLSRQNKGVENRAKRDQLEEKEQEDVLIKSRQALEAKSRLYDEMSNKLPDNETSELYLVDFQRKIINSDKEKKLAESTEDGKNEIVNEVADEIAASCSDEEWIDYTDALGRSRRCLKKDLSYLQQIDQSLSRKERPVDVSSKWSNTNDLLSDDMRKEIERQQWEKEEEKEAESNISTPVGPVHYQTVQQQEVRNHGVGYYAFSTDEEERRRQLQLLENLRKQTENQKSSREKLKEKRQAMLRARLEKVKLRKNVNLPLDEPDEAEIVEEKPIEEKTTPSIVATTEKNATVRPWDRGKIGVRNDQFNKPPAKKQMSEGEWIERQRQGRDQEFAPPQFYYNQRKCNKWSTLPSSSSSSSNENNTINSNLYFNEENENKNSQTSTPLPEDITQIPLPEETLPVI